MFAGKLPRLTNLVHVLHVRRECRERGVASADQRLVDKVDLPIAEVEPHVSQETAEAVAVADVSFQIEIATEREQPREVGRGFLTEAFGWTIGIVGLRRVDEDEAHRLVPAVDIDPDGVSVGDLDQRDRLAS